MTDLSELIERYENGEIYRFGEPTKQWLLPNGVLHRLDGPAIEYGSGAKEWYANGKLHRVGGPAAEWVTHTSNRWCLKWYAKGQRHRLDGPAIEWANGSKEWWVNDNRVEQSWLEENGFSVPLTEDQQVLLFLRWGTSNG